MHKHGKARSLARFAVEAAVKRSHNPNSLQQLEDDLRKDLLEAFCEAERDGAGKMHKAAIDHLENGHILSGKMEAASRLRTNLDPADVLDEQLDEDTVEVSRATARSALTEIRAMIKRTADEEPDPLADCTFEAKNELEQVLEEEEGSTS